MNTYNRGEIINNLINSDLIKEVNIVKDTAYITLTTKANGSGSDKRNSVYVNLDSGIMFIKKLANGMYRDTAKLIDDAKIVNDSVI